jgi:acyl-coenzyme A synthetase/AMP-(fatty) acid ligase
MTMPPINAPSLDMLLKAHAARNPNVVALIDPPNIEQVTGARPRSLTYMQADRAVGAIAARLREVGLAPGTVVGVQMPNVAVTILTLLAIMRAGMIAAPLPLLWRRADCVTALSKSGARAIVTCGQTAGFDHAALALEVAAELFPIRAVCGFNCADTDGIIPFDDLLSGGDEHPDTILFQDDARASYALVTYDVTSDGIVPIARDTAQLLAGGRLVRQRAGIGPNAVILSTLPATSFAGWSAALVPWLLSGGTLVLHHPFDSNILREQIERERCNALVVPDAMLPGLIACDWMEPAGVRSVIPVWRAPERLAIAAQWTNLDVTLVDVAAFGETALLAARRTPGGRTLPWPTGALSVAEGGPACATVALTASGTLAVQGALAGTVFDPYGSEKVTVTSGIVSYVDTGYPCRMTPEGDALLVTAAPAGLIAVGGYRFAIHDLQRMVRDIDNNGVLAALPHGLSGHRLAGHAPNPAAMRDMFQTIGMNPLLAVAFSDRVA